MTNASTTVVKDLTAIITVDSATMTSEAIEAMIATEIQARTIRIRELATEVQAAAYNYVVYPKVIKNRMAYEQALAIITEHRSDLRTLERARLHIISERTGIPSQLGG